MRRYLLHIALLLALAAPALAGETDAGRESPFSLGAGARALGMGGGFTALADGGSVVYYNPAGLSLLEYQQFSFMHATLFEGTIYDFGSWVVPISDQEGFGIGFMRIGTDDITRREDFVDQGQFDYSFSQMMFSYGHELFSQAALGVTFKVINQSVDKLSDYAYGADVGASARITNYLRLGVIARDLVSPKIVLDSSSETLPWSVSGGFGLENLRVSDQLKFNASFDLEKFEDRSLKVHAGGEAVFHNYYSVRAGYDRDNLTLGVGARIDRLQIDYAFKQMDVIGDSHRFSISLMVGKSMTQRREERQRRLTPPAPPPISEEEKRFLSLKDKGDAFFRQLQFDSALVYYDEALAIHDDNEQILEAIDAIERARQSQAEQQAKLRIAQQELRQFVERYLSQAVVFYDKKYYPAALDLLELILEIDPQQQKALALKEEITAVMKAEVNQYEQQAKVAEREGRTIDAIDAYNRVLYLEPDNKPIQDAKQKALATLDVPQKINLGIKLFTEGKYSESKQRFESVLQVNPKEQVATEYLKKIEAAQEQASSLEDLQRDRQIWDLYLEGIRYMRNNEYQKAIDVWEQVLKAYPNNVNTLNNIEQAKLRLQSEQGK